jgi:hypothetical protein
MKDGKGRCPGNQHSPQASGPGESIVLKGRLTSSGKGEKPVIDDDRGSSELGVQDTQIHLNLSKCPTATPRVSLLPN